MGWLVHPNPNGLCGWGVWLGLVGWERGQSSSPFTFASFCKPYRYTPRRVSFSDGDPSVEPVVSKGAEGVLVHFAHFLHSLETVQKSQESKESLSELDRPFG